MILVYIMYNSKELEFFIPGKIIGCTADILKEQVLPSIREDSLARGFDTGAGIFFLI